MRTRNQMRFDSIQMAASAIKAHADRLEELARTGSRIHDNGAEHLLSRCENYLSEIDSQMCIYQQCRRWSDGEE